jgi:acetylornithine deacetylase/succinyl-diaminopimelate desuccinylase-like protein
MSIPTAEEEVVGIARDLIRIDTSNTGDTATSAGERAAAEYVAAKLDEVGIASTIYESEPGRASLVARIEGGNSERGGLVLHGHLDVVPANAPDWQVDPFSGEIRDGYLWGRGAVDMKDMDAMILAVVRQWAREGRRPPRDITLAFFADEEAGSVKGAHWLIDNHPEVFDGATEAVSEVGGFSLTVTDDLRLYLIETAEKGIHWLRLNARGKAGHGSFTHDDNAITTLSEAVSRIGRYQFPLVFNDSVKQFLEGASDALGIELDPGEPELVVAKLGPIARMIGATLRNTANPTMLDAGYKANVIPGTASATIDGRVLPGQEKEFIAKIRELAGPDVEVETIIEQIPLETTFDGQLVDAMADALRFEDPGARPVPYMMSGGTDGKALSRLGIRCFGFAPLRLPPDLDFASLFHGVDERVPLDGLGFGVRVLDRFLSRS